MERITLALARTPASSLSGASRRSGISPTENFFARRCAPVRLFAVHLSDEFTFVASCRRPSARIGPRITRLKKMAAFLHAWRGSDRHVGRR